MKIISKDTLEQCGFLEHSPNDYLLKNIILRDGRSAVLWVNNQTGHGILDPVYWEKKDFYNEKYRDEFTSELGSKVENNRNLEVSSIINEKQFKDIKPLLKHSSNYIEIGCSFGGVFNKVVDFGVKEACAVEPSVNDSHFVQSNNPSAIIYNDCFENIKLPENHFDVAVSIEVLEHTYNPNDFLEKCSVILKHGASIYLEVPNHNDVLYSTYKANYGYKNFFYHKAHIHYFTPLSLELLCEKHGFKGAINSFLMYPFFNHVYWSQNNAPQNSAAKALYTPQPGNELLKDGMTINTFYKKVEKEYENLINNMMLGDCLVYKGYLNKYNS